MYGMRRAVLPVSGMMICGMASGCPCTIWCRSGTIWYIPATGNRLTNRLKRPNNFPEFTSRVCPAFCEAACTCGLNGDPVSTKENEYAIIENAYQRGLCGSQAPRGAYRQKVAVIGSGPSGLAAADLAGTREDIRSQYLSARPCRRTVNVRHPQHEAGETDH